MFVSLPDLNIPVSALFCQGLKFEDLHSSFIGQWAHFLLNRKLINWMGFWPRAEPYGCQVYCSMQTQTVLQNESMGYYGTGSQWVYQYASITISSLNFFTHSSWKKRSQQAFQQKIQLS